MKYTVNVRCVIALDFEMEAEDKRNAEEWVRIMLDRGDINMVAQDCNGNHPELNWCDTEIYEAQEVTE